MKRIYGENYLKDLKTPFCFNHDFVLIDKKEWEECCKLLNELESLTFAHSNDNFTKEIDKVNKPQIFPKIKLKRLDNKKYK